MKLRWSLVVRGTVRLAVILLALFALASSASIPTNAAGPSEPIPGKRMIILVGGITTHYPDAQNNDLGVVDAAWQIRTWLATERGYKPEDIIYFSYSANVLAMNNADEYYDPTFTFRVVDYACVDTFRPLVDVAANFAKIYELFPDQTFDIIAHSLGGMVTMRAMMEYPTLASRTHAIITLDSPVRGLGPLEFREIIGKPLFRSKCADKGEGNMLPPFGDVPSVNDLNELSSTVRSLRETVGETVDIASIGNSRDPIVPSKWTYVDDYWLPFSDIVTVGPNLLGALFHPSEWFDNHSKVTRIINDSEAAAQVEPLIRGALTNNGPVWRMQACRAEPLSSGTVSPTGGTTSDTYDASVTFRNPCGRPPTWVSVNLFGPGGEVRSATMSPSSPGDQTNDYQSGVTFVSEAFSSLAEGAWTFQFRAHDGVGATPVFEVLLAVVAPGEPPETNPAPPSERQLSITSDTPVVLDGQSVSRITATLLDKDTGVPVQTALVTFSTNSPNGGWADVSGNIDLSLNYDYTDASGQATVYFRPLALGMTFITASITGGVSDFTSFQTISDPSLIPDFELTADVRHFELGRNGADTATISVAGENGFFGLTSLTAEGLPDGATGFFSPSVVATGETSSLNLSIGSSVEFDSYVFDVIGTANARTRTLTMTLEVTQGSITLISPAGGEIFLETDPITIEWSYPGAGSIDLDITNNGGRIWFDELLSWPNGGSYIWDPLPYGPGANFLIRISPSNDSTVRDVTDSYFTVCRPGEVIVSLFTPAGGSTYLPGDEVYISWETVTCGQPATVDIEYSSDDGTTWTPIALGVPDGGDYPWTAPFVSSEGYLLRVSATDSLGNTGSDTLLSELHVTTDSNPWTLFANGLEIIDIAVHPTDAQIAYFATERSGVYKTIDGGQNVTSLTPTTYEDVRSVTIDPSNPNIIYVASLSPAGVLKSADAGTSWAFYDSGIHPPGDSFVPWVTDVAVDPQNSSVLFATTEDGFYRSTDSGVNWQILDWSDQTGTFVDNEGVIAIHPGNSSTIYLGLDGGWVVKSTDGGVTWDTLDIDGPESIDGKWVADIAIDTNNQDRLIAVATESGGEAGGIYRTADAGTTWELIGTEILPVNGPSAVAIDPLDSTVYVGVDGDNVSNPHPSVYRSSDFGETWSLFSPCDGNVISLGVGHSKVDLLYAGYKGCGTPGLATKELGASYSAVLTRPAGFENWMAGTTETVEWTTFPSAGDSASLAYTTDGGTSWTDVAVGAPDSGSLQWQLPSVGIPLVQVRVRIFKDSQVVALDISESLAIVDDQDVPTIESISLSPQPQQGVQQGQSLLVSVVITDIGTGVDPSTLSVDLVGTQDGSTATLSLLNTGGDTYEGVVDTSQMLEQRYVLAVTASDMVGNTTTTGGLATILVYDFPSIQVPAVTPVIVTDRDEILVCNSVEDDSQIDMATFEYTLDGGVTFTNVEMSATQAQWCSTVGPFRAGIMSYRTIATDVFGNASEGQLFDLTINDDTPPEVWTAEPSGGGVPLDANVEVTFSEQMDRGVTEGAITVAPTTSFSASWATGLFGNDVLQLDFSADLEPGAIYMVTVGANAADLARFALDSNSDGIGSRSEEDDFSWSFTAEVVGVCGDLNGDALVNVLDAIIILQIIVGVIEPTPEQLVLSDLNRDGTTDVFDAILLLQHIVGLIEITECGPPVN